MFNYCINKNRIEANNKTESKLITRSRAAVIILKNGNLTIQIFFNPIVSKLWVFDTALPMPVMYSL